MIGQMRFGRRASQWARVYGNRTSSSKALSSSPHWRACANPALSQDSKDSNRYWALTAAAIAAAATSSILCNNEGKKADCSYDLTCGVESEEGQVLTNWSSTHSCAPRRIYEPKSAQEVVRVLQMFHEKKERIRPVGTALSPNGIGMNSKSSESLLSLAHIDNVKVDVAKKQVTVGAGARVSSVLAELKKHGLTLQNFSSIQEQQLGGWTQVAAHGTGCTLPTVDEMIVSMQIATPSDGLIDLSEKRNPHFFKMARVGLGTLGVVTEMTLNCIPQLDLKEETFVVDRSQIAIGHADRLKRYRHVRYMWIPYTPSVVVVVSNPYPKKAESTGRVAATSAYAGAARTMMPVADSKNGVDEGTCTEPKHPPTKSMCNLLHELRPDIPENELPKLTFSQLRDQLLDIAPLDQHHVVRVNQAEAEFWKASQGVRVDDSTNILGFDCGGEQWVLEVSFPIGSLAEGSRQDITFVQNLLDVAEKAGIPAPSPIEQRWTARSSSPMSPAYAPEGFESEIFSWVGIIMYLPPNQTAEQRAAITDKFKGYVASLQPLMDAYHAQPHWAKIELPDSYLKDKTNKKELNEMRARLASRYNVPQFNMYRKAVDPHGILSNDVISALFDDDSEGEGHGK